MWREAVDLAYTTVDYDALAKAGVEVVLRYLSPTPGKGLTAAERDRIWAAGLAILPLYETSATAALGGFQTGAQQALDAARIGASLGLPAGFEIWYAIDFDATAAQMAGPVTQFVRGLRSVAGADGLYGGVAQLNFLHKAGLTDDTGFQTYAWSDGAWTTHAKIQQYANGVHLAGGVVDRCRVDDTLPLWRPGMELTDKLPSGITVGSALDTLLSRSANLGPWTKIELDSIKSEVESILTAHSVDPATPEEISDASVATIAKAVSDMLAARLVA